MTAKPTPSPVPLAVDAPTRPLPLRVLLVDPVASEARAVKARLHDLGHEVGEATNAKGALEALRRRDYDVILCDVALPDVEPVVFQQRLARQSPGVDVVCMARVGSVAEAVAAVKAGATDYLARPLDDALLGHALERIADRLRLERDLADARQEVAETVLGGAMVGTSKVMRRMFGRIDRVARSEAPVVLLGESGTGKELVSRLVHAHSAREKGPFVAVNCAAFPETLLEAELFGHEKGAFTGAVRQRRGRFATASGGTLFLDEVAELPMQAQAKLLRVLQDGQIEPLGSDKTQKIDVRIISATHRDLRQRVASGQFREDLYFRLRVLEVRIPPLRERTGDLPVLVEHFLNRLSFQEPIPTIAARAWAALMNHPWPGNVRELEHALQQGVVLSDGREIDLCHLPNEIGEQDDEDDAEDVPHMLTLNEASRAFEREYLLRALRMASGKRTEAARLLGVSRKNLWEKLKAHGLADHLRAGS